MEALGIDIKLLFAQTINFLLFTYIFQRFMYTPFKEHLAKERREEDERARLLKDLQEKEDKLTAKEKETLADARAQGHIMMKEAEAAAAKKKKELLNQAQQEIMDMKKKAEQDIKDDKKKLYDEVKSHVVKTSQTLTASVLKDFLDEKNQKSILEGVFKKLKSSKVYEN